MAAVTLIIQRDTCQPIIRRHTRQTTTNKLTLQRLTKHRSKHNLFKRFLILSGFLTTNTRLSHRIDCSINHINLSTNIHPKLVIFHPDKILPQFVSLLALAPLALGADPYHPPAPASGGLSWHAGLPEGPVRGEAGLRSLVPVPRPLHGAETGYE